MKSQSVTTKPRTTRLVVYCAGAYSGSDVITIRGNVRRGLQMATRVLQAGFAPFAPWNDEHFSMFADISLQTYYDYSMAILEKCDAVLVMPVGAEQSKPQRCINVGRFRRPDGGRRGNATDVFAARKAC
jgi:hypothetical protein